MPLREILSLALTALRTNKLRSFLTILGVTIGIIGFGIVSVMGRTRVPLPPARMTAFIRSQVRRFRARA